MWFDGKNPNEKVKLDTTSAAVTSYQAEFIITALALTMQSILPAVINTAYL